MKVNSKIWFIGLLLIGIVMGGCGSWEATSTTTTSTLTETTTSTTTAGETTTTTGGSTSTTSVATTSTTTTSTLPDTTPPTVSLTSPANHSTGKAVNSNITATFVEAMDPTTISTETFSVMQGLTPVLGIVTYAGTVATFNPNNPLAASTTYEATITTGVKDLAGNALAGNKIWSFTTGTAEAVGPATVNLGTAGNFVILSKSGISTVPTSALTGDIGVSPIDSTAITGFSLIMDSTNMYSTATQVVGKIYAADYTSPTPSNLTTAISNMETACIDAAGRPSPDFIELGAGEIGGQTLVPGLYKWGTGVSISTDVTLSGGPNDVWIFQIAGDITVASGVRVTLAGGAQPQNIFWQTFGAVMLDTTSHFEGIVLSNTEIILRTGATMNGRLLSQTAVTLDTSTVTQPIE
ncbi:MAG: ice-binding family protein [Candidatus Margulisiibacteriota bacterium]